MGLGCERSDRENTTVFVSRLPAEATEEDLTKMFKDVRPSFFDVWCAQPSDSDKTLSAFFQCGRIREIKISPRADGLVVATVEFFERESVPAALTKDKKRLNEAEIEVSIAWQSTLYVTNFPESADDAYIRNLFEPVSQTLCSSPLANALTKSFCYAVRSHPRNSMAGQEVQGHPTIRLRPVPLSGSSSTILTIPWDFKLTSRVSSRSRTLVVRPSFALPQRQRTWPRASLVGRHLEPLAQEGADRRQGIRQGSCRLANVQIRQQEGLGEAFQAGA